MPAVKVLSARTSALAVPEVSALVACCSVEKIRGSVRGEGCTKKGNKKAGLMT